LPKTSAATSDFSNDSAQDSITIPIRDSGPRLNEKAKHRQFENSEPQVFCPMRAFAFPPKTFGILFIRGMPPAIAGREAGMTDNHIVPGVV
jgi:hypothetical protein